MRKKRQGERGMNRKKISVIGGAGNVGAACGMLIAQRQLANVVLVDMRGDAARGRALDILQATALWGSEVSVSGTDDYAAIEGSDIVVVTAGRARRPGESRADMVELGKNIMVGTKERPGVIPNIVRYAPHSMILMVSNPMDVMTYVALKVSGFEKNRVFGQGGVLDSARFQILVAAALGISRKDVRAWVLGEHGDSMVPLTRLSTALGVPLEDCFKKDVLNSIIERVRNGGREIVELAGGAYVAPALAVVEMIEAVLCDKKQVLPCSVYLDGEYGRSEICLGVPVLLGGGGAERIVELFLSDQEIEALRRSGERVREVTVLTAL
jgi:malate dehydrogenase